MSKWLIFLALGILAGHKTYTWFKSPDYLTFIEKNKYKPWAGPLLLKSGLYWTIFENWRQAEKFFNRCASEDMKQKAEYSTCLYYKAYCLSLRSQIDEALALYSSFLEEFPNHPKAELAHQKMAKIIQSRNSPL